MATSGTAASLFQFQTLPVIQPTMAPAGMAATRTNMGEKTSAMAAVDPAGQMKTAARMPSSTASAAAPAPTDAQAPSRAPPNQRSPYGNAAQSANGMASGLNPDPTMDVTATTPRPSIAMRRCGPAKAAAPNGRTGRVRST